MEENKVLDPLTIVDAQVPGTGKGADEIRREDMEGMYDNLETGLTANEAINTSEVTTQPEEVLTQVVSVASEEKRTGQKIPVPSPDELFSRANASFLKNWAEYGRVFADFSSKQKTRVSIAVLALPEDGVPVKLKTDEEKYCYAVGQKAKMDQFTIIQYHIHQQVQANKKEQEEKAKESLKLNELSGDSGVIGGDTPQNTP